MVVINPSNPLFWNHEDAAAEMTRVFDICNGCRLCDNLCPSFNDLFDRIETIDDEQTRTGRQHDNPALALTEADSDHVTDVCYQCKICYVKCPYTPPHEYALDFPRLLLRWQAIRTKERGSSMLQDVALGNTKLVGEIGSTFPTVMNWANTNSLSRIAMEKTVGIHRDKKLPTYHAQTFEEWYARHASKRSASDATPTNGKVALFYTCSVNYNTPDVGKACVAVLEHNNVEVIVPKQVCCGMPQLGTGDYTATRHAVDANIALLTPYVDKGYTIVTPGPSCGYMMRQEYQHLATDTGAAQRIAAATMDICEYLMKLHQQKKLATDFKTVDTKISYHLPCHLKAQNIGFKSRDLLKLIPGVTVEMVQQCSGHDGSWSMKQQYYEISLQVGKKLFDKIIKEEAPQVASDCVLAHLHIAEGTGKDAQHPIEIVRAAYGI